MRRLLLVVALCAACDDEPPKKPPQIVEVGADLGAWCAERAAAVCDAWARCWPNSLPKPDRVCREEQIRQCAGSLETPKLHGADAVATLGKEIRASRAKFETDAAKACLDGLRSTCGPVFPTRACKLDAFVRPLVPPGGTCVASYECQGGFCRYATDVDCSGVCTALRPADDPCDLDSECSAELWCPSQDLLCTARVADLAACGPSDQCLTGASCLSGFCVRQPKPGEDCSTDGPACEFPGRCSGGKCVVVGTQGTSCQVYSAEITCAPELYCDRGTDLQQPGVCQPRQGLAGPCYFAWDCLPGLVCANPDFSGRVPGQCAGAVDLARSCDDSTGYTTVCARGAFCGADNVCVAYPATGESCDSRDARCPAGSRCTGGTCQAFSGNAVNEPCGTSSGDCAPDAWCEFVPTTTEGTCRARRLESAACTSHTQCLSRRCITGACASGC